MLTNIIHFLKLIYVIKIKRVIIHETKFDIEYSVKSNKKGYTMIIDYGDLMVEEEFDGIFTGLHRAQKTLKAALVNS